MKRLLSVIASVFLFVGCAGIPSQEELTVRPKCTVVSRQGLFSEMVEPEKSEATIKTKDCLFLFWGCHYLKSAVNPSGDLYFAEGNAFGERKNRYGALKGDEIVRSKSSSELGVALQGLAAKVAQENGNIKINREKNEVRFPSITGFDGVTHDGPTFNFSPSCSMEQIAVGTVAIDSISKIHR